tara:strand:- start:37 stop:777 length:741 start_codon:yes stop_codon:yes gene_type:complete
MNKVFIFDVDGTLTPSRLSMTKKFKKFFKEWSKKNTFYLVTGSDLPKMQEQVPEDILELASGIFTCCGNQYWKEGNTKQWPTDWRLIYNNKFTPPETLIEYLKNQLEESPYSVRAGNHIEDRNSMLNFSVIGRDCTQEQREKYFKYDKESGERQRIAGNIRFRWSGLDAVIGGQISIDIYPKGMDKSQILKYILEPKTKYYFIGDRIENNGNDYPLAKLMNETDNCSSLQTDGWQQTQQILEKLSD